jgi:hypothetical protein
MPTVGCAEALARKAAADAPNVMQTMMLLQQARFRAKSAQDRAKATQEQAKSANKVVLQAEKENDASKKEFQELKRVMEPKRARTHADTAEDDEECEKQSCDDWDLPDLRRQSTRIQNHRSIPLGSRLEVPTPALAEKFQSSAEKFQLTFVLLEQASRVSSRGRTGYHSGLPRSCPWQRPNFEVCRTHVRSKSGRRTLTHHGHLWLC